MGPFVAEPDVATTQTFITIGFYKNKYEAEALLKYIKGKFARAMLGTLKITQHNKRDTWKNVPLQDLPPIPTLIGASRWRKSTSNLPQV